MLVLQFHNSSQYGDLDWVGESISEKLRDEFSGANEIVFGRDARTEALRRLTLHPGADYTKATLIRLGQSLDADYVCYGTYDATLPAGTTELKNSSIQVNAHLLDLRKLHNGPDFSEAGKLVDLARLEEHLAWENLRYLNPGANLPMDRFMSPAKFTRVDAEESYVRGLLTTDPEQQRKWFAQALVLDPKFMSPAYELGRLALEKKEYRRAVSWLQRIPATNPRYFEARFKMGLAAYGDSDYVSAALYFREISRAYPLNEVYNNLGAAEDQMNQPGATEDFRRALEGDGNDVTYLFNLANNLLKTNHFEESAKLLRTALTQDAEDEGAKTLLARAQRHEFTTGGKEVEPDRLKKSIDLMAFRQLKAVIQPKAGS